MALNLDAIKAKLNQLNKTDDKKNQTFNRTAIYNSDNFWTNT